MRGSLQNHLSPATKVNWVKNAGWGAGGLLSAYALCYSREMHTPCPMWITTSLTLILPSQWIRQIWRPSCMTDRHKWGFSEASPFREWCQSAPSWWCLRFWIDWIVNAQLPGEDCGVFSARVPVVSIHRILGVLWEAMFPILLFIPFLFITYPEKSVVSSSCVPSPRVKKMSFSSRQIYAHFSRIQTQDAVIIYLRFVSS